MGNDHHDAEACEEIVCENGLNGFQTMENGYDGGETFKKTTCKNGLNNSQTLLHDEVVEALLKEAEKRGLTNCTLDITSGSNKGDNYMGIVAKVVVTGNNSEGKEVKLNWIAKAAPQTDLYRSLLKIDSAYAREVYMYELFDRFKKFQTEKGVLRPFKAHPKFILSYLEPYKESFVMEDLKAENYVLRDRKQPLDINHVKLVMKEYGRLHAISFALRDQRPEEFETISKDAEDKQFVKPADGKGLEEIIKYNDTFINRLVEAMHEETDTDAIESLKLYRKNAANIQMDTVRTTSQYSVIGHGDCWANNFMWKYEDSENPKVPTQVCVLDWQVARYGSPALDLSYFIYACTDQKFREKHFDQMIKLYYYTLCTNLTEMGSDPEKLFPFSALEDELRRHFSFGFYMGTMALQVMLSETSEVPEWQKSDNVGDFMDAFNYKSVNDHLFKERARGVVLHMQQKGYFNFLKQR